MIQDPGSNLFLWRQRVAAAERTARERLWLCCAPLLSPLSSLRMRLTGRVPASTAGARAC